jgi:hypothetical protein
MQPQGFLKMNTEELLSTVGELVSKYKYVQVWYRKPSECGAEIIPRHIEVSLNPEEVNLERASKILNMRGTLCAQMQRIAVMLEAMLGEFCNVRISKSRTAFPVVRITFHSHIPTLGSVWQHRTTQFRCTVVDVENLTKIIIEDEKDGRCQVGHQYFHDCKLIQTNP